MTRPTDIFESETCGRCCGTGQYSFHPDHGTVCFGCKGSGKVLSRAGKRAYEAYKAANTDHVLASDIVAGDKIVRDGRVHTVVAVREGTGAYILGGVSKATLMLELKNGSRFGCPTDHPIDRWTQRVPLPPVKA